LVLLEGEGSGQIAGLGREVFSTNEIGLNRVAVEGEIVQQAAETKEVIAASFVAQRLFTKPAEPAEHMRIAAQLRGAGEAGERRCGDKPGSGAP